MFNQLFDFCNSDKPSLFRMQEDKYQAIFILLCKKTFQCLNFKCYLEDTSQMLTYSNYCRVFFHVAEIILSPKSFCHFTKFFARQGYICP